jgi:hypothetical protein
MKILDKRKDYYDYLQGIYGIDELVVYDRRDSFPIDVSKPICDRGTYCRDYYNANCDRWFRREILFDDEKRKEIRYYQSNSAIKRRERELEEKRKEDALSKGHKPPKPTLPTNIKEGKIYHFALEVGFYRYYFEVERYIDDDNKLVLNYALFDKKRIDKDNRISYAPMCIFPVTRTYRDKIVINDDDREQKIMNPILYATYIPKCIEAKDIWNELYEYISSLRDKEFVDSRTNDQHIESHGFDKKISFRHRK